MFKVGDKVKCVDDRNSGHLVIGDIYNVIDVATNSENRRLIKLETFPEQLYFEHRFALVGEGQMKFVVGDIVFCEKPMITDLDYGKHYTVEKVDGNYIKVSDDETSCWYNMKNFKLVRHAETKDHYMKDRYSEAVEKIKAIYTDDILSFTQSEMVERILREVFNLEPEWKTVRTCEFKPIKEDNV